MLPRNPAALPCGRTVLRHALAACSAPAPGLITATESYLEVLSLCEDLPAEARLSNAARHRSGHGLRISSKRDISRLCSMRMPVQFLGAAK